MIVHFNRKKRDNHLPVRNGISSDRVRSTPSANAIVDNFLMLFKRNYDKEKK